MRPRLTLTLLACFAVATFVDNYLQTIVTHDRCEVLWYSNPMLNGALSDYTLEVSVKPQDANAHFCLGNAWYDRAEFDKAIASYNRAIELDPQMAVAYTKRGIVWKAKDLHEKSKADFERAVTIFTRQIQSTPEDPRLHFERGLAFLELANRDKANADFEQATAKATTLIEKRIDKTKNTFLRGLVAKTQNKMNQAVADFRNVVEQEPENEEAHVELGLALCWQQEFEESIAVFDNVIRLEPRDTRYYRYRGRAWKEKGIALSSKHIPPNLNSDTPELANANDQPGLSEYKNAIVDFDLAISKDVNDWHSYRDRAEVYMLLGQIDKAIADYGTCTNLAPRDYRPRINLAIALAKKKETLAAIHNLEMAIRLKPSNADSYFLRAQPLYEVGSRDDAIYHLEQAIELNPQQAPYYQQKMKAWQALYQRHQPALQFDADERQQSQVDTDVDQSASQVVLN